MGIAQRRDNVIFFILHIFINFRTKLDIEILERTIISTDESLKLATVEAFQQILFRKTLVNCFRKKMESNKG